MKNYFIHMRPHSFIPSFFLAFSGYACSSVKPDTFSLVLGHMAIIFGVYSILLFGGTAALNTAFDGESDGKPLNYLDHPPSNPKHLGLFGLFLMVLAVFISYFLGTLVFYASLFILLLSILYSARLGKIPRGKEVGGLDSVINSLGCGFASLFFGHALAGGAFDMRFFMICVAFTLSVWGSYPATQIYQLEPTDNYARAKNYSTLLGPSLALRLGSIFFAVAVFIIGYILWEDQYIHYFQIGELVLYAAFGSIYLFAAVKVFRWAKNPYENSKNKLETLLKTLFLGRICWIIAEWVRWA